MPSPRPKSAKSPTSRQAITHQLRELILASGLTPYEIGRRAGLESGIIRRFLKWERGLTLDSIDQLADALGFRLASTARGKAKPKNQAPAVAEEVAITTPTVSPEESQEAQPVDPEPTPKALPQEVASQPEGVLTMAVPLSFEESPQVAASGPEEANTSQPPAPEPDERPEILEATPGPSAEPTEDTDDAPESSRPWWEELVWRSAEVGGD